MGPFRKSPRARHLDYTANGAYYITLNVQKRLRLFGRIETRKMLLNDAGEMLRYWLNEVQNKFPDWYCQCYVIMPDHMHAVFYKDSELIKEDKSQIESKRRGGPMCPHSLSKTSPFSIQPVDCIKSGQQRLDVSLSTTVQWFKTMTTNEYIRNVKTNEWETFHGKLWQRSFHDRLIRNKEEYERAVDYIMNNPSTEDM